MELIEAKICAMISLVLGSMLVGLLPAWFSSYGRTNHPLLLSLLLCFGGGVLLSTSIIHMLPEIRENLPDHKEYTELLFCTGFFALYLIDEVVHYCFGNSHVQVEENTKRSKTNKRHYGSVVVEGEVYSTHSRQLAYNPHYLDESGELLFNDRPQTQLCHIGHKAPCRNNAPVNCYGLLAALSIHAVLEGLAVGLENSPAQVLLLFGAISSHKLVVGFCLGIELSSGEQTTQWRHFVSIVIFSAGTPAGIALGMTSINEVPDNILIYLLPILQCLAGGTLLYVSVSEVLPRERARWHQKNEHRSAGLSQFTSVIIGFTIMTALTKYMES